MSLGEMEQTQEALDLVGQRIREAKDTMEVILHTEEVADKKMLSDREVGVLQEAATLLSRILIATEGLRMKKPFEVTASWQSKKVGQN